MDLFPTLPFDALSLADGAALALFILAILGVTALIERKNAPRLSTARLMAARRAQWMALMAERDIRIMDAALLAIQHQGTAFFASASMIAIGGVVALIGAADQVLAVARDLTPEAGERHRVVWELKMLFLLVILVLALLKFIWAHRLFGYCSVLIGATPGVDDAERRALAEEAGALNIQAGRNFNRGLRLVYFALASLAWMLGPWAFMIATLLTVAMLIRREFFSTTHRTLQGERPD